MRPIILISAMIVLLAALATLFWMHPTAKVVTSNSVQPLIAFSNAPVVATKVVSYVASTSAPSNTEMPTNQSTFEKPKPTPEMIRKYMESFNIPIQFYGKIIDQDGNPLADAVVQGEVLHIKVIAPVPGGGQDEIIPFDQKADLNGRFEIHGMTGRGVVIESLQKMAMIQNRGRIVPDR